MRMERAMVEPLQWKGAKAEVDERVEKGEDLTQENKYANVEVESQSVGGERAEKEP